MGGQEGTESREMALSFKTSLTSWCVAARGGGAMAGRCDCHLASRSAVVGGREQDGTKVERRDVSSHFRLRCSLLCSTLRRDVEATSVVTLRARPLLWSSRQQLGGLHCDDVAPFFPSLASCRGTARWELAMAVEDGSSRLSPRPLASRCAAAHRQRMHWSKMALPLSSRLLPAVL